MIEPGFNDRWKDGEDALPVVGRQDFFRGRERVMTPDPVKTLVNTVHAEAVGPNKSSLVRLRQALFEEIESLRQGKSDANRAMAVSKLAAQVVNSVSVEVKFMEVTGARMPGKPSRAD